MAKKKPVSTDLAEQSVGLAEFAAKALVAAEQLGMKKKVVNGFSLDDSERAVAADLPSLSATVKKKLAKDNATFTVADTATRLHLNAAWQMAGRGVLSFARLEIVAPSFIMT